MVHGEWVWIKNGLWGVGLDKVGFVGSVVWIKNGLWEVGFI